MSDTIRKEPNIRRRNARLALLLVALVPIIANAFVALKSLGAQRDAYARVARAHHAILLVQQAEDLIIASGKDYYLYRLFGGEERLTSYRKAMLALPAMEAKLRDLVAEGADQSNRLDRLASLIEQNNAIWRHRWRRPNQMTSSRPCSPN